MTITLLQFSYCACTYIPRSIWHQTREIAMETNLAPLFTNLSLAFFELDASRSLYITIPNMARYLDDILGNTNTESDAQLQSTMAIIYQPAQLKFTKTEKFCNHTVYLDIQLPSPQSGTI
jgi:hypothetical protein